MVPAENSVSIRRYAVVEIQEPDDEISKIVIVLGAWLKNVAPSSKSTFEADCPIPYPFNGKKIASMVESQKEEVDRSWENLHVTIFSFTSKNTFNQILNL